MEKITLRHLTVTRTSCDRSRPDDFSTWVQKVPHLRIEGLWLAQAGLPIGTRVEVIVTPGTLVLTRLHPEDPPA